MSMLSTTKYRNYCLILAMLFAIALQSTVYGQTILRVDGENGLAVPNPPDPGDTWTNAFKYLKDAIAFAKLNPGAEDRWVAATDPSNPYRPDQDAANPGGTADRTATFLLDFNNIRILGGFVGGINGETDPLLRDPLNNITVLSGLLSLALPCGDPGAGNCFKGNGSISCDDEDCCDAVCALDPTCCNVEWDQRCADLAFTVCGSCGDPGAGECDSANGTPGCNDSSCCSMVCVALPDCCLNVWDAACVNLPMMYAAYAENLVRATASIQEVTAHLDVMMQIAAQ